MKASDLVVLNLQMTAKEARLLRDELYGRLGHYENLCNQSDSGWDYSIRVTFQKFVEHAGQKTYSKAVSPVLQKLYLAMRVSLHQSAVMPELNGPYASRVPLEQSRMSLYEEWIKQKISSLGLFHAAESLEGNGKRLIEMFVRSLSDCRLFVHWKVEGDKVVFGVENEQATEEPAESFLRKVGEIKWFKSIGEFRDHLIAHAKKNGPPEVYEGI